MIPMGVVGVSGESVAVGSAKAICSVLLKRVAERARVQCYRQQHEPL